MTQRVPRPRRRRLEPLSQRARRWLARLAGREAKDQRVYAVGFGAFTLKQIVFAHAEQAARLEAILARLRDERIAPAPVARYGRELWLEFLEGEPPAERPAPVDELARVFASLYRTAPREVASSERDFAGEIERDLDLLYAAGAIGGPDHAALRERSRKWCPRSLWVGHDYSDARPANFLRLASGELRVVDVESLQDDALLGAGLVRAASRWPGLEREVLLARLRARDAAPFEPHLDFVELWYLAGWTKRCWLQGKRRLVDPRRLAELARR